MNNELLDQELNFEELQEVSGAMIEICPPWWPRPRFPFPFPSPGPTFPDMPKDRTDNLINQRVDNIKSSPTQFQRNSLFGAYH